MAHLKIPEGLTFDTLLSTWPDEPLPNISGFDTLAAQGNPGQITKLVAWIEPQQVCGVILKHHGAKGLQRVLKGIAAAASKHQIAMRPRVQSIAEFYGMQVY